MTTADFSALIVGTAIRSQFRLTKQTFSKPSPHSQHTPTHSSYSTTSFPALPVSRKLSTKSSPSRSSLLRKVISEKILCTKLATPKLSYSDPPTQSEKSFHNERVFWNKRNLGDLPVLIIVFEGVLGSYARSDFWTEDRPSFTFRDRVLQGLCKLKEDFYLVLISTYTKPVTKELISLVDQKQNIFDAVYMQRHRTWHDRHIHNVDSVLKDFCVEGVLKVLALAAIGIDTQEIISRKGEQLVSEPTASAKKRFLTYFAPSCSEESPVTILVPHFLLSKVQSFYDIGSFVLKFNRTSLDFFTGFEDFCAGPKVQSVFTESSHKNATLPSYRFIFFTKQNLKPPKYLASSYSKGKPRRIRL